MNLDGELAKAVLDGDLAKAEGLFKRGAKATYRGTSTFEDYGKGLIYLTIQNNNLNADNRLRLVQLLLNNGADSELDQLNDMVWIIKSASMPSADQRILEILIDKGIEKNSSVFRRSIILTSEGLTDDLHIESQVGPYPRQISYDSQMDDWSFLHLAAHNGKLNVVQGMLKLPVKKRGNINNTESTYGFTPLHVAAVCGRSAVASFLVDQGANILAQDKNGKTPLDIAIEYGKTEVANFLRAKRDEALFFALQSGDLIKIINLFNDGVSVEAKGIDNETPLCVASRIGKVDVLQFLFSKNANVNVQDNNRKTPLHHAAMIGQLNAVRLLVDRGANILAQDKNGKTPLDIAIQYGKTEVAGFLRLLMPTTTRAPAFRKRNCNHWQKVWYPGWCRELVRYRRSIDQFHVELSSNAATLVGKANETSVKGVGNTGKVVPEIKNISAQFDINGGILLADILLAKKGKRQVYTPSVDKQISSLEAQACALNIVDRFESILKQAALRCGISVQQLKVDSQEIQSSILKKIMAGDYRGASGVLYSAAEKACPALEQKKKFSMSCKTKIEQMLEKEAMPLVNKTNVDPSSVSTNKAVALSGPRTNLNNVSITSNSTKLIR